MYLSWGQHTLTDFSTSAVEAMYDAGYVFTRLGYGVMNKTRNVRIDLSRFELSSENRRIIKKTSELTFTVEQIPYMKYTWQIGKLASDFYKARNATFSANKVRELLTNGAKSNFNYLFVFGGGDVEAFAITYVTPHMLHYSYPFYTGDSRDLGLGMMTRAILWAKEHGKKYAYLGSLQRPNDGYKLQFEGAEWFDGEIWSTNIDAAKEIIKTA